MTDDTTVISLAADGRTDIEVILRAPDPETLTRAVETLQEMDAELCQLLNDLTWGVDEPLNPLIVHLDRSTQILLGVIVTDQQLHRTDVLTYIRKVLTHPRLPETLTAQLTTTQEALP